MWGEKGDYIPIATLSPPERGREIIYLSLHCHHRNNSCIKMGSDESHFNVSLYCGEGQSLKTVSTGHNLFEEKGEPKRNRAFCFTQA